MRRGGAFAAQAAISTQAIRSDDEVIGQMQADFMGKALRGKGNVVMLRGPPGTSWAEIRGNSFKKPSPKHPQRGQRTATNLIKARTSSDSNRVQDILVTRPPPQHLDCDAYEIRVNWHH